MSGSYIDWRCNLDAEAAVLSHLLERPDDVDDLVPLLIGGSDTFYSKSNQLIYAAIVELREKGVAIGIDTIAELLKQRERLDQAGGSPYLVRLQLEVPTTLDIQESARVVRDRFRARQAAAYAQQIAASLRGAPLGDEDLQNLLESAEATFAGLSEHRVEQTMVPTREVLTEVHDSLVAAVQRGTAVTGTETGFANVDAKTGGAQDGELTVIAGRPSHGKTAFVLNIAERTAAKGNGVAIFSLEMPAVQLGHRLLATEGRVPLQLFRNPGKLKAVHWNEIANAMQTLSTRPLWIDDRGALSIGEMRRAVRRLKRDIANGRTKVPCNALKLVIVDYLQLATASDRTIKNREQEVSNISRNLKKLAKDEGVAVIAVSQLNRAVETRTSTKQRPQLSDLRESGAIEQDADVVLFVHRPEMYSDEPEHKGIAEIIVAKLRQGGIGTLRLAYRGEYVRFDPLASTYEDLYDSEDPDEFADVADPQ